MKDRRKKSHETEQTYRSLIQSIKDYAIFMLDKKGVITTWDQGAMKLFGYKRGEIVGANFSILFTAEDQKKKIPQSDMATAIAEGRQLDERQYVHKNKTRFWSNGVLTSSKDKQGAHQGFSKIMRDVTEQTELHRTAVHNSTHDFLTGLPNRSCFEENLIDSILNNEKGCFLAVMYMDFNNFKRTNDEQGHRFGDLVLIEIAHRLSHSVRSSDMVARFGGDEFVILTRGLESEADGVRLAQKTIHLFDEPIVIEKKSINTSVSIGLAFYPTHGKKPSELLHFADSALYQAKRLGGSQYQLYDPSRVKVFGQKKNGPKKSEHAAPSTDS